MLDVGVKAVGAGESGALSGMHGEGLASTSGFAFALADGDGGVVAVGTGLDAIVSCAENRECLVGGIHFEGIVVAEAAHGDVDGAGTELDLHRVVIEVQERKSSIRCETDDSGSELDLGSRILIGPELVAGSHGTIRNGPDPFGFSGRLEGNGALQVTDAGDAGRRIVRIAILSGG